MILQLCYRHTHTYSCAMTPARRNESNIKKKQQHSKMIRNGSKTICISDNTSYIVITRYITLKLIEICICFKHMISEKKLGICQTSLKKSSCIHRCQPFPSPPHFYQLAKSEKHSFQDSADVYIGPIVWSRLK